MLILNAALPKNAVSIGWPRRCIHMGRRGMTTLDTKLSKKQMGDLEFVQNELSPLRKQIKQESGKRKSLMTLPKLELENISQAVSFEKYLSDIYPKMLSFNSYNRKTNLFSSLRQLTGDIEAHCLIELIANNWSKNIDTRVYTLDLISQLIYRNEISDAVYVLMRLVQSSFTDREVLMFRTELQRRGCFVRLDVPLRKAVFTFLQLAQEKYRRNELKDMLAELIIRTALFQGKPLLATAIALNLKPKNITMTILTSVITSLSYAHKEVGRYHLLAVQKLIAAFPQKLISMSPTTKARLLSLSFGLSKADNIPSIANDCYNMIKWVDGGALPMGIRYKLLTKYIQSGTLDHAAALWNDIKGEYVGISQHDMATLSRLIFAFSGEKKYMAVADNIVKLLPHSYYGHEGISEALLMYCSRRRNYKLAKEVYASIPQPIRRSTLTYLLHLHVSLGDVKGTEKILTEIKSRGGELNSEELARIVKSLSTIDMGKAESLVQKFSHDAAYQAHAAIVNTAIEKRDFDTADKYLELISKTIPSNNHEIGGLSVNLTLKRLVASNDLKAIRKLWQKWLVEEALPKVQYKYMALRTVLDEYIRQNDPIGARWVIDEMRALNFTPGQIQNYIVQRANFHNMNQNDKRAWKKLTLK